MNIKNIVLLFVVVCFETFSNDLMDSNTNSKVDTTRITSKIQTNGITIDVTRDTTLVDTNLINTNTADSIEKVDAINHRKKRAAEERNNEIEARCRNIDRLEEWYHSGNRTYIIGMCLSYGSIVTGWLHQDAQINPPELGLIHPLFGVAGFIMQKAGLIMINSSASDIEEIQRTIFGATAAKSNHKTFFLVGTSFEITGLAGSIIGMRNDNIPLLFTSICMFTIGKQTFMIISDILASRYIKETRNRCYCNTLQSFKIAPEFDLHGNVGISCSVGF